MTKINTDTLILAFALVPYLIAALYDGWLHEKARRVPKVEQALHATIAVSLLVLLPSLFNGHPIAARISLCCFLLAAFVDEWRYHGPLETRERRLHFVAYGCFLAFVGVATAQGRFS